MTNNIEIPNYKPLVPNGVWSKDLGEVAWPSGKKVDSKEIFAGFTYESPAQQQVLDLIQRVAREYSTGKFDVQPSSQTAIDELALAQLLTRFRPNELEAIMTGEKDTVAHLNKDICTGPSTDPRISPTVLPFPPSTTTNCPSSRIPTPAERFILTAFSPK